MKRLTNNKFFINGCILISIIIVYFLLYLILNLSVKSFIKNFDLLKYSENKTYDILINLKNHFDLKKNINSKIYSNKITILSEQSQFIPDGSHLIADFIGEEKESYYSNNIEIDQNILFINSKNVFLNHDSVYFFNNVKDISYVNFNSLDGLGFSNIHIDPDNIVRRMPLIAKYNERIFKKFTGLKEDEYYDKIFLLGYKITYNKKNNSYTMADMDYPLYNQNNKNFSFRKKLNRNDIDLIKAKIETYRLNFELELDILRGKVKKNHSFIIDKIYKYLGTDNIMPDEMKSEIKDIILDKDYLNELDFILDRFISGFKALQKKDKKWRVEIDYFNKLIKECMKIDRLNNSKRIEAVSLYDLLYNRKKIYFEKLLLINERFILSLPLQLICKYYNISNDNVKLFFGRHIILTCNENDKQYKLPIDDKGFSIINYDKINNFKKNIYSFNDPDDLNNKSRIYLLTLNNDDSFKTPIGNLSRNDIMINSFISLFSSNNLSPVKTYINYLIVIILAFLITIIFYIYNKNAMIFSLLILIIYIIFIVFMFFLFKYVFDLFNVTFMIFLAIIINLFVRRSKFVKLKTLK